MTNIPMAQLVDQTQAKDLMQKDVLVIRADTPTATAIELLEENGVSGAPVADSAGGLIGVLTASDVTRREHVVRGRLEAERAEHVLSDMSDDAETEQFTQDNYNPEVLGGEVAQDWMHPGIVSVHPEASLREVCNVMADESIHRVLVIDGHDLKGIVTTLDVVRFLANLQ